MLLSLDGQGPRYAQIARALVASIRQGALAPGARALSTRALARDLGCSRNVVLLAYEQLLVEGYLVGRPREGTFVAPDLPRGPIEPVSARASGAGRRATATLCRRGQRLAGAATSAMVPLRHGPRCPIDFVYGLSEPDDRLLRQLRRALSKPLREGAFSYATPAGDPALREQIALRLRSTRGISRSADHMVLTSGTQQALDICARLLVENGDRVVVEDPGYDAATAVFRAAGARVLHARVDRDGLDPNDLPQPGRPTRLVYVTPSHQFPTGALMTVSRRHALLEWARRARAFVFEDDYDGEFRYSGQPITALAGFDPDTVIYCGTFAKSLFPSCRLGYLVLPPALVDAAVRCKWIADRGCSRILERAVGELLAAGHYDRHVRRTERRYRQRCDVLVRSLYTHLGRAVEIEGSSAGLHLVAWLPALPPDRVGALIAASRERGVGVYPLSRHAARPPRRAALLLGYGLVDAGDIERGVRGLADAYRQVLYQSRPTASAAGMSS